MRLVNGFQDRYAGKKLTVEWFEEVIRQKQPAGEGRLK